MPLLHLIIRSLTFDQSVSVSRMQHTGCWESTRNWLLNHRVEVSLPFIRRTQLLLLSSPQLPTPPLLPLSKKTWKLILVLRYWFENTPTSFPFNFFFSLKEVFNRHAYFNVWHCAWRDRNIHTSGHINTLWASFYRCVNRERFFPGQSRDQQQSV